MLFRLTTRLLGRFCAKSVQTAQSSTIVQSSRANQVPVHLRPYDRSKYEVPMEKIKLNSGYAFLQVEPFPRAKIMKTCYHIMEQLSIGFPETCVFKIYNQERTKYIMKIVDETIDVQELQDSFGVQIIEFFIDNLVRQLQVINIMRAKQIWLYENDDSYDPHFVEQMTPERDEKYPAYQKSERPRSSFVQ